MTDVTHPDKGVYCQGGISVIPFHRIRKHGVPDQYRLILMESATEGKMRFPGGRYWTPTGGITLEDAAIRRFEETTGLEVAVNHGLRVMGPSRNVRNARWMFRNIVFLEVDDLETKKKTPEGRSLYLANPGIGNGSTTVRPFDKKKDISLDLLRKDDKAVAKVAYHQITRWAEGSEWYKRIPVLKVPGIDGETREDLGYGLPVASIVLLYQPDDDQRVILLKRIKDKHPGFAGGKIEIPDTGRNIDPITCCAQEGAEEFGFGIIAKSLIGVAITPLKVPKGEPIDGYFHSLITYAFLAEPEKAADVRLALDSPKNFLGEKKFEGYEVMSYDQIREAAANDLLRMPDNAAIVDEFFRTGPGEKINLNQIKGGLGKF